VRRAVGAGAALLTLALQGLLSQGAGATTIGEVATGTAPTCPITESLWLGQRATVGVSYTVPSGGGAITSWSTSYGSPRTKVGLLVLREESSATFEVVGSDEEALPSPIPEGNVSSFTPPRPILTQAGDFLGLYATPGAACIIFGRSGDTVPVGFLSSFPPAGTILTSRGEEGEVLVNVSAQLQQLDGSLTQTISPSSSVAGGLAVVHLRAGYAPAVAPAATITDVLPAGLQALAAGATPGGCATAGQTVTCHLSEEGSSAEAIVVVSAATAGSYANSANLDIAPLLDANPANNVAAATLTVNAPESPQPPATAASCRPLKLTGVKQSLAEAVLRQLNCTIGKVTHSHSKTVAKGLLLSENPSSGTLPANTKIAIVVSAGKPPRKAHHKRKRKH
jgi:Domain of unknown function DUF11